MSYVLCLILTLILILILLYTYSYLLFNTNVLFHCSDCIYSLYLVSYTSLYYIYYTNTLIIPSPLGSTHRR